MRETERKRQTDRQTDRDRQRQRGTERQRDRETETERQRQRKEEGDRQRQRWRQTTHTLSTETKEWHFNGQFKTATEHNKEIAAD